MRLSFFLFTFVFECLCVYLRVNLLWNETESCIQIEKERETILHSTTRNSLLLVWVETQNQCYFSCSFASHSSNKWLFIYLFSFFFLLTNSSDRVIWQLTYGSKFKLESIQVHFCFLHQEIERFSLTVCHDAYLQSYQEMGEKDH